MICDNCLHADVCGEEGAFEPALTYCADFLGWIPVSERLPDKSGNYLITYCYMDKIETQEAIYVEGEEEDKWYDTTDIEITLAVIAWMPSPNPYVPDINIGKMVENPTGSESEG